MLTTHDPATSEVGAFYGKKYCLYLIEVVARGFLTAATGRFAFFCFI
jgi:hypothetical protein